MTTPDFRRELARSAALRRGLGSYIYVLMSQLSASAACLRVHLIGPRLTRWLLMSEDRAHSERFHVTQEFLAYMLGVRCVGITAMPRRTGLFLACAIHHGSRITSPHFPNP